MSFNEKEIKEIKQFKGIKVRLYPTKLQQETIDKTLGSIRYIYNLALETKLVHYNCQKQQGIDKPLGLSYNQLCSDFKDIRNSDEFKWLQETNMQVFQQSLRNLETAYDRFFKGLSKFPKFKSKKHLNKAKFTSQFISKDTFKNDKLNLTKSLKDIEFSCSNKDREYLKQYKDTIQNITISRNPSGQYYASICIERIKVIKSKPLNYVVGLDLGIKSLVITSEGEIFDNQKYFTKSQKKLVKLQRRLSKKVKGSKNYNKARLKVARLHNKIANQRLNYLHNISSKIINDNQVIIIEDLNIQGMIKNHRLAKSISDISLGELTSQLIYKAEWYDRQTIKIDRWFPSSKHCSSCNNNKQDLTLNDRIYNCSNCGLSIDRDLNASINIKNEGLNLLNNKESKDRVADTRIKEVIL